MSRLPCSFCLCSLATSIADIIFHYLYYTAEHQAEQWSGSLVHNITCTCFSILAIHPMFENTGILALFVKFLCDNIAVSPNPCHHQEHELFPFLCSCALHTGATLCGQPCTF